MSIAFEVNMDTLPENCNECVCHWCHLPLACNPRGGVTDKVKKEYTKKRHKNCPLFEVTEWGAK